VELASSVSKRRRCCRLRYGSPSCPTCTDDGVRFDVYEFHRSGMAVSKGGTHVFFVNNGDFCQQSGRTNDLFKSCSPKNRIALVETDGPGSRPGWPREFAPVGAAPDILRQVPMHPLRHVRQLRQLCQQVYLRCQDSGWTPMAACRPAASGEVAGRAPRVASGSDRGR
jgi:hypothetical protein